MAYVFDELAAAGDTEKGTKHLPRMQEMCNNESSLSRMDLHCRGSDCRRAGSLCKLQSQDAFTQASSPTLTWRQVGYGQCELCVYPASPLFLKDIVDRAVMNSKFDWAWGTIKRLAMQSLALIYAAGSAGITITMQNGEFLTVIASGAVRGLVAFLISIHRSVATSWQHMWTSMVEEGELTMAWGEEVPLLDLIFFALTVVKFRRRKNKSAWTGKTLSTLKQVQLAILGFLHGNMAAALTEHMRAHNVYQGQVPSAISPNCPKAEAAWLLSIVNDFLYLP